MGVSDMSSFWLWFWSNERVDGMDLCFANRSSGFGMVVVCT